MIIKNKKINHNNFKNKKENCHCFIKKNYFKIYNKNKQSSKKLYLYKIKSNQKFKLIIPFHLLQKLQILKYKAHRLQFILN